MRSLVITIALVGLGWLLPLASLSQNLYQGEGLVVAVNEEKRMVVLDHEEIQGYMSAMVIGFPVASPGLLEGLKPGDRVSFTLQVTGPSAVIVEIAKAESKRKLSKPELFAPDFGLSDLSGKTVRLSNFRGKAILLNFWATWCAPCRQEMASMERAYREYKDRGLAVLAVSLDRGSQSAVEAFVRQLNLSFPVLLDPTKKIANIYRVYGLPTTYLIDRYGYIVVREYGGRDWSSEMARLGFELLLRE